jgi:hypothetical protein
MSAGHFIEKCKECGTVINQCRCPSKEKVITYNICSKCENKIKNGFSSAPKEEISIKPDKKEDKE